MHIRCKGSKSSGFKFSAQGASASTASAHDITRVSTDMDNMEISMLSDTTIHPSVTNPNSVHGPVCTDVKHVVSQSIGGGNNRRWRLSNIQKRSCETSKQHHKQQTLS